MSEKERKKSFVFVLNHINVKGELPIEVAPGHFFQKANVEQIKKIKELLNLFRTFPHQILKTSPYEVNTVKVPTEKPGSFHYRNEPLPEGEWRYWIISFEGTNAELEYIASAASLLEHDLELGFHVFDLPEGGVGFGWHSALMFSFFDNLGLGGYEHAVVMTSDELREIPVNYNLLKKLSQEHEHIKRAFIKWHDLKSLPRISELVIVSLFSIIESLVTHNPTLKESSDSLTHQISTKISLLSKRFQRRMNYNTYFGEISETKAWAKLYGYRSQIVHGEHSDLRGSLQVLKDRKTVIDFLRETVKVLLLLALREPVLLTDLKNC